MCTVTIIPKGNKDFILTSNRDEAPNRIPVAPEFYTIKNKQLLFPKDKLSGGTWIGISENNRIICLLNGGFQIHKRKPIYKVSRGVVTKDLMVATHIVDTIKSYDFSNIEPFTIIIADWNSGLKFYELVWDEKQIHFTELPLEPKIWSSSTLYNDEMKSSRLEWFQDFKSNNDLNAKSILNFHQTAGKKYLNYGVIMDRGFVKTTSITQIEKTNTIVEMRYNNLQDLKNTTKVFKLSTVENE